MPLLKAFLAAEDGATPIEFGLFSALVSLVAITALGVMDDGIAPVFSVSDQAIKAAVPAGDA